MVEQIYWSDCAKKTLHEIFYFYQSIGGDVKAYRIIDNILQRTEQLLHFPYSGPIENQVAGKYSLCRYLVYSHYKIYYYVEEKKICILAVWDTRQDPVKLWKFLRENV